MSRGSEMFGFRKDRRDASASVGGSPTRPWLLARANSSEVNLHQQHLSSAGFSAAFLSVLEHLCSLYETEPRRREKLFQELCSRMPGLTFEAPVYQLPELSYLRSRYHNAFLRLVRLSQGAVDRAFGSSPNVLPRIRLSLYQTDLQEFFQTSRYRSEYDDEVFLARGGFGAVYRARNKLDGCSYAIKKVLCRGDRDTFTKIIREVTTLASLDHPNIVSYKTAWLEPFIPGEGSLAQEVAVSSGEAKETVSSCSWSPEEEVSSGGIVFEASKGDSKDKSSRKLFVQIQELQDEEDTDSKLSLVTGVAATPPNASGLALASRRSPTCENDKLQKDLALLLAKKDGHHSNTVDNDANAVKPYQSSTSSPSMSCPPSTFDSAVLYIQMQLCNRTLRQWLDDRNESNTGACETDNGVVMQQILRGTMYLHSQHIVHRDLKPKNIFFDKNNRVQIGDFGLAKNLFLATVPTPDEEKKFHRSGSYHTSGVGTQAYAAPEQLTEGIIDEKSDMYSIGIILFELYQPFSTAMERTKSIKSLRDGCLEPSSEINPEIRQIIYQLTHPDRTCRPSASQLLDTYFTSDAKHMRELEAEVKYLKKLVRSRDEELTQKNEEIEKLKEAVAAFTTSFS